MKISNHLLEGDGITYQPTPNVGGPLAPRYLVFHYTAGSSAQSAVGTLCNPRSKASAHLVVGRDGSVIQLAPFNVVCWHAGISQWQGLIGLNSHSIGIEMDNAGLLKRVGSRYEAWFGRAYPEDEVLLAEHKQGGGIQPWHSYTEAQIGRALALAELLIDAYALQDVLGHEDIAPGRKSDPGPAFPLQTIRSRGIGRKDDEPEVYRVTATSLNIRRGPGVEYEAVAAPLRLGTEVHLLQASDSWNRVEVVDQDISGWVSNRFIERVAATAGAARAMPPVAPRGAAMRGSAAAPRTTKATRGKATRARATPSKTTRAKTTRAGRKSRRPAS